MALPLELTLEECKELRRQARRAVGRVSERIHYVLLHARGFRQNERDSPKNSPRSKRLAGMALPGNWVRMNWLALAGLTTVVSGSKIGRPPLKLPFNC